MSTFTVKATSVNIYLFSDILCGDLSYLSFERTSVLRKLTCHIALIVVKYHVTSVSTIFKKTLNRPFIQCKGQLC